MKWIKVTESLPEIGKVVCIRFETSHAQNWRYDSSHREYLESVLRKKPHSTIEWLDESAQDMLFTSYQIKSIAIDVMDIMETDHITVAERRAKVFRFIDEYLKQQSLTTQSEPK